MSKKVNPAAVGLFVAGALVILLAGLVVLGSGKFFEKRKRFVTYFQSSANGLEVGSEVKLGGVTIGRVINMYFQFDPATGEKIIPVVFELSADRIAGLSLNEKRSKDEIFSEESIRQSIEERGLRARLMNKSALTGQLFVDLDFFPESEADYTFPGETIDGLVQIPSTKNEIQRVLELKNLLAAVDGEQVNLAIENAAEAMENANTAIDNILFPAVVPSARRKTRPATTS
jgi:paraquat-inducible protein B